MVEPLFKLSFSEDNLRSPADLFTSNVTQQDLQLEESQGRIGNENLPVYVKSVTYGRILMYTLTSSEVDSFEKLSAAVEASFKSFKADSSYSEESRRIISNSRETFIAFGGSQSASKEAILDLKKFFVPIESSQTVPISYEIRDIKGNVAKIGDITEYKVQNCTSRPNTVKKRVTVTLNRISVQSDCDGLFDKTAEIRGPFKAFGKLVVDVRRDIKQGHTSDFGNNLTQLFTSPHPNDTISVTGSFIDDDSPLSPDRIGSFVDSYRYPNWPQNKLVAKTLSGDGCRITVFYTISTQDE